ncbi:MAG: hypothetical protein ACK5B9_06115 [Flavobacteriia bacterium]|jgi:hypothetical protein
MNIKIYMFKMKTENLNDSNKSFTIESDFLKISQSAQNLTETLEKLQSELKKLQFRRKLLNQKS